MYFQQDKLGSKERISDIEAFEREKEHQPKGWQLI